MSERIEGFVSGTADGRFRLLQGDGSYVELDPQLVVAAERLDDHDSGLEVWAVEHEDRNPVLGSLDPDDLDRLFVLDERDALAAAAGREDTRYVHCPPTVPLAVCVETKHGPCV